ncbi:DDE-type integrase/transposase/recombinase, partial [Methylobacterium aquaticum]|uniref:DDE-type integrase/transposase/recombinase n=1 Tax=Methylobacterium aquaticum TaxID=270351 RepID=UPI003D16A0B2
ATERAIQIMAEREGWNTDPYRARRRSGRGGGMEYNIGLLPTLAQVTYRQRAMASIGSAPEPDVQPRAALSGRAALERDARLAILRAYDLFARGQRLNQQGCEQLFLAKYQAGTFAIEEWVKKLVPKFSRRTLARWRAEAETDPDGLAHDPGAARRGTGALDTANGGAVRDYMLGVIAFQPHMSAEAVREQCRGRFGDTVTVRGGREIPMPPLRTFQVALKALKEENKAALTKRTDPDRFRSHMALSGIGSLRHIDQPNLLWQIDASPVDALCTDGRHSIYVCVDIASRRAVFYMSKTARAEAVGLLLRKAILAWGVPAEIKTDNGSDFTARATERLLLSLGITGTLSDSFSPEQKGHVERLIKTFQHDAVTLMPGFIGHSVADRKAIEGRKGFAQRLGMDEAEMFSVQCSAAEMQEHFDAWAELRYAQRPNKGIGGRTPADIAAAASHTIRRVDVRALDILLAPAVRGDGTRVMMKTGIHVDGRPYHCGSILPTTRVFVRMDPLDLGRIYLFDLDGETFLGEGINVEFSGLPAAAALKAQKELRAKKMAEALAPIDASLREIRNGPGFARIAREVWTRDDAKRQAETADLLPFPRPEVEHTTPQIAAALDAATHRERRAPAKAVLTPKAAELHAQLKEQAHAASNVTRLPIAPAKETPRRKFERMYAIELRHAAGEFVDPDDLIALGSYQQTPDYTALRKMYGADRKQSAS